MKTYSLVTTTAQATQDSIKSLVACGTSFAKEDMQLYGQAIKQARKDRKEQLGSFTLAQVGGQVSALPEGFKLAKTKVTESSRAHRQVWTFEKAKVTSKVSIKAKLASMQAEVEALREELAKKNAVNV
jgi:hypothetical protein